MNPGFPNLQIVPVNSLVLHEEIDRRRVEKYIRAFTKSKCLYDPPIVTKIKANKYLVLDGANRTTVFKKLSIPHITVQVVEYREPVVELRTWNHLICDQKFKRYCQKNFIRFSVGNLKKMLDFVNIYNGRFNFYRVVGDDFKKLQRQYKNATCLVVFPKFKPLDIIRFSLNGEKIPSGITRHLISGRALSINIPLEILQAKKSLSVKNDWLKKITEEKVKINKVRYYAESTYVFYN